MNGPYRPDGAVRDMQDTVEESSLPVPSPIELARRLAALTGLAGLVLASVAWTLRPDAFWRAYLFAWLCWASATLGCAVLTLPVRDLRRDPAMRTVLRAGRRTTPLVAVLIVPLVLHGSEPVRCLAGVAAARPLALTTRCVLVGPALAGLALALAVLAILSRCEPAALAPAAARILRLSLSALLAADATAAFVLRAHASSAADAFAAAEIGVALGLTLPWQARQLATGAIAAFVARGAMLRDLLPEPTVLPADPTWIPYALDLLLAGAVGGVWLALFFWRLDRDPPPPFPPVVDASSAGVC